MRCVPVLVEDHMNDGDNWTEAISEHGCAVIPWWGLYWLGPWPMA
ncbi:hypothetical protein ACFFGR_08835 [Arthrobacter liuii]|nr:hypothetical protein [Arthrobacter liuii]